MRSVRIREKTVPKYDLKTRERGNLGISRTNGLYYLTQDHLGGTALVTDASAALISRIRYFPYGGVRTIEGTNPPPTDKLFTGQQRETANGIYHYKARLYNTDVGRMPQPDSVIPSDPDPQAYNRYSYVNNNPVTYADPSGHSYRTAYADWWWLNVAYVRVWQGWYYNGGLITGIGPRSIAYWPAPWAENTNIKVTIPPYVAGFYWRWPPYLIRLDVRARFVATTWILVWPKFQTRDVWIYIDLWGDGSYTSGSYG